MKFLYLFISVISWSLSFASLVSAQMHGEDRRVFVASHYKSCFKSQRDAPQNASVDSAVIKAYCLCTANYVADSMSNERAKNIYEGYDRINPNLIQMAGRYCANNL
jgi:hypothetical protein